MWEGDLEHKRTVTEEKQILFSKEFKLPISQTVSARTGENVSWVISLVKNDSKFYDCIKKISL